MVMQVVTPENFSQLVETGKVDEFKPPEAGKEVEKTSEQPRGADGKFTKPDDGGKNPPAGAKPEADDDEGDDDLPERARKQIGKKHRQMKEAEEFGKSEYLKRRAAEERAEKLERELGEKSKSRPVPEDAPKEPKQEDFATVGEYVDALTEYRLNKKLAERDAKAAQERREAEAAQRQREFAGRLAEARTEFADWDAVIDNIAGSELDSVPTDVIEYLQESEHGPRLMYHLAKNPTDLERFRKLSPRKFIAELGKLETRFEKAAEPEKKASLSETAASAATVSKAPAPIAPIEGGTASIQKDPSKMTFRELREYERQREAAARR